MILPPEQGGAPLSPPKPSPDKVFRNYKLGAAAVLLLAVGFVGGFFLGEAQNLNAATSEPVAALELVTRVKNLGGSAPAGVKDVDFSQFWEVWDTLKAKYVSQEEVTDEKLFYGAIQGLVGSLGDPYSVYFDPPTAKRFNDDLGGTFEGIGAEIGIKKNTLIIIAPLPGTPAERSGLKPGDYILTIDGKDTEGMYLDEAVSLIRGKKGTEVKLSIHREGFEEPKEFAITRAAIKVDSVKSEVKSAAGKRVAVITVSHFNEDTGSGFSDAVRATLLEGVDGIVLDLRNDPGGFLDMAAKVAGEWVGHEPVVIEEFSDGRRNNVNGDAAARLADVPTVVLVNGGSASASEIVAGALQDYGKATLVGEKTFGKGSVQDYSEFGDGSALKVTVALWLTPKGRSINKEGIQPDVEVENTPEDWDNNRDPQMDKAIEMLTAPAAAEGGDR